MSNPADEARLDAEPILLRVYALAIAALSPWLGRYLTRRAALGKEDPARIRERYGIASKGRPNGLLIWFHAASVGEAMSTMRLIDRVLVERPDAKILVTTGTVTSAKMVVRRMGDKIIHQYVPLDRRAYTERFLKHWRPDFAVWIESELWPNLLTGIFRRGIPAALINARMSERSYTRWKWAVGTIRRLLSGFRLVLAQTPRDAEKLAALGARDAGYVGHLKYAAEPLPADPAALAGLKAAIGTRPLWVLASSHSGEDEIAIGAHKIAAEKYPGLLTIIAPRHTQRASAIADLAESAGLTASLRSEQQIPSARDAIHVVDAMGELGLWYRLAPIACIGGSLVPVGGHNPIEAAQLDCALIFGPHMFSVADVADELLAANAAKTVTDPDALAAVVMQLLDDPAEAQRRAAAASAVAARNRHVIDRVFDALSPLLDRAASHRDAA